jgi:hypothetical protein
MDCPKCGTPEFEAICDGCGNRKLKTLAFGREDGTLIPIGRSSITLTQAWAIRTLGPEASVWEQNGQCRLEAGESGWTLKHLPTATNQTLVNGKAVTEVPLNEGDTVSVGREDRGISRTPMVTKLL